MALKIIKLIGVALLYYFCFVQCTYTTFAQSDDFYQQIAPPSPEASNLGKYGEHAIGYYSGTVNTEIPLYNVKDGKIDLPINISYYASGVKVEEISSRIGLGWVLNAGGVITRAMQGGYNDDMPKRSWACPDGDYDQGSCEVSGYFELGGGYPEDQEPDMFYFNFNGKSGKFVFDKDQNIYLIPYKPWKITHELNNGNYVAGQPIPGINKFNIVTDDGIEYTFAAAEKTFSYSTCGGSVFSLLLSQRSYPSAWYLTEIFDPSTRSQIKLSYKTLYDQIAYDVNMSETFNISGPQASLPGCCLTTSYNAPCKNETKLTYARIIERIDFNSGYVLFNSTNSRQDFTGDLEMNGLSVYDKNNNLIKSFDFILDYAHQPGCEDAICKRLYLKEIVELGKNENKLRSHKFYYNDINALPARNSSNQDVFGYYKENGSTNLRPKIFVYPNYGKNIFSVLKRNIFEGNEYVIEGNDRSPDDEDVQYGMLQKIEYPTGGSTLFFYEPNEFHLWSEDFRGNGVRILRTITCDGLSTSNCIQKDFSYNRSDNSTVSSGAVISLPEFAYLCMAQPEGMSNLEYYNTHTVIKNRNLSVLGSGSLVGYSEVTERQINNGKKTFAYTSPLETPDMETAYSYTYSGSPGTCASDLLPLLQNYNKYPFFGKTSMDTRRGLLQTETVFSEAGDMLKQTSYEYDTLKKDEIIVSSRSGFDHTDERQTYVTIYASYKIHAEAVLLSKEITSDFYEDETVTVEKNLGYNQYDLIDWETRSTSDGFIKVEYKYPFNTAITNTTYDRMVELNMLNAVVEESVFKNEKKIAGIKNEYNEFPSVIDGVSSQIIQLEDKKRWKTDNTYTEELRVNKYDDFGNVLELVNKDGIVSSYLWGYKNTVPIAEVENTDHGVTFGEYSTTHFVSAEVSESSPETPLWPTFEVFSNQNINPSLYVLAAGSNTPSSPLLSVVLRRADGTWVHGHNPGWGENEMGSIALTPGLYQWFYSTDDISFDENFTQVDFSISTDYLARHAASKVFHTSFEEDGSTDANAKTGSKVWVGPYDVSLPGINGTYKLSYWKRTGTNPWLLMEETITVSSGVVQPFTIGDYGIAIDEVRLYPVGALMTTYTHNPLIGITSSTDPNNIITYFEYDEFNRLQLIRNQYGDIVKKYEYQYKK